MTIAVDRRDGNAIQNIVSDLGEIGGEYDIKITKRRPKRSKDANAYMWELVGQVAEKIQSTPTQIYRELVRDYGIFEILPVKTEHVDHWRETWGRNGIGWITEDLGECRNHAGYHNIRTYYGTSVYDTKQMARLIDGLVDECKALGIETLTPQEIEIMLGKEKK